MDILLVSIGSHGDVHPFLGLGRALQQRGHDVTLVASGYFEPLARRAGVRLLAFGTADDYLRAIENPDLWSLRRGFKTVMDMVAQQMPALYDLIAGRAVPGRTVVLASSAALAARVVQDKLGIATVTVHLAPVVFRSVQQVPVGLPGVDLSGLPRFVERALWWAGDRFYLDPVVAPPVNALRARVGLPPVRRLFADWIHSPLLTLGLFPEWFAPPQPDWPPQTRLTGFPLFDEQDLAPVPDDLEQFLAAGTSPIVFTPGSAMRHGRPFCDAAVAACRLLGRRGILLTRFPENVPPDLPPSVRHFDYVPLSALLPRAAALVHHGGIGTTAQGLAAGIPQLVMPLSHDQPDQAMRLRRLGVGAHLVPRRFRGPAVAAALRALLESPAVRSRAAELAGRMRGTNPVKQTCELIEAIDPAAQYPVSNG